MSEAPPEPSNVPEAAPPPVNFNVNELMGGLASMGSEMVKTQSLVNLLEQRLTNVLAPPTFVAADDSGFSGPTPRVPTELVNTRTQELVDLQDRLARLIDRLTV